MTMYGANELAALRSAVSLGGRPMLREVHGDVMRTTGSEGHAGNKDLTGVKGLAALGICDNRMVKEERA